MLWQNIKMKLLARLPTPHPATQQRSLARLPACLPACMLSFLIVARLAAECPTATVPRHCFSNPPHRCSWSSQSSSSSSSSSFVSQGARTAPSKAQRSHVGREGPQACPCRMRPSGSAPPSRGAGATPCSRRGLFHSSFVYSSGPFAWAWSGAQPIHISGAGGGRALSIRDSDQESISKREPSPR